jgi:hypothetical protein
MLPGYGSGSFRNVTRHTKTECGVPKDIDEGKELKLRSRSERSGK